MIRYLHVPAALYKGFVSHRLAPDSTLSSHMSPHSSGTLRHMDLPFVYYQLHGEVVPDWLLLRLPVYHWL